MDVGEESEQQPGRDTTRGAASTRRMDRRLLRRLLGTCVFSAVEVLILDVDVFWFGLFKNHRDFEFCSFESEMCGFTDAWSNFVL